MAEVLGLNTIATMAEVEDQAPSMYPALPEIGDGEDFAEYDDRLNTASRQRILWIFANALTEADLRMEIMYMTQEWMHDPVLQFQIEREAEASRELFAQILGKDEDEEDSDDEMEE